ncbi:MAG: hypothetical protein ACRD1U_08045 [Vicinamibacterales bacterium]
MPDPAALTALASQFGVDFTGPIGHQKVTDLARMWLPDLNFHEVEMFHTIDLEELYTVPAIEFAGFDPATQAQFAISVGGVLAAPPIIRVGDTLRGSGGTADDALLQAEVDGSAVYSHGGSVRAGDKFFGSAATRDGTPNADAANPRLPRVPLRVRTEFRMLLETLKQTLVLSEAQIAAPVDAIWGDFDVTDLLLRRVNNIGADTGPASKDVRHQFARDLITAFEAGDLVGVEQRLQSSPPDGLFQTKANPTVWLALSMCGFMEYYFVYAYNDFSRYGGVFTNEHEGDNEGCCLVFERLALHDLQAQNGNPAAVAPLGLITSVHNESNRADELRALDVDPGDARDGLDVFIARGSHATYLTAGTHDFFDISDAAREDDLVAFGLVVLTIINPLLLIGLLLYEHFNGDPDETSSNGVAGQHEVDPLSDPATHLPVDLVVTPLSLFGSDDCIYDPARTPPAALALRAFRGRLGAHDGRKDRSPQWQNKTRRYFTHLIAALDSGQFRPPRRPIIIL